MTVDPAPAPRLHPEAGVAQLTRQICDIRSESGQETRLADAVIQLLQEQAPHLSTHRNGDTIVAQTTLNREKRVIIAGHLDTVPVNNNLPVNETLQPETGERVLWGRGTVDMKAGVAVQLALAVQLTEPVHDITWVWYDHEEVASELSGLGRTIRESPELFAADFAILGEPTAAKIEGGCNGTLRARVTFHGRRAHSARSWMGVNAIHAAGQLLAALAAHETETVRVDGLDYREGLNAVRADGGVAGNVIPDAFTVELNYRYAPNRTPEEAARTVREFVARAVPHALLVDATKSDAAAPAVESVDPEDPARTITFEIVDHAPGARPGLHIPLAAEFVRSVGKEACAKQGWTDVARFSALGVPAVNFGPGDPLLAHADDERVPVTQIEDCYTALLEWLS